MNEALCSILYEQDRWAFAPHVFEYIKFNKDGTGEVYTNRTPDRSTKFPQVPGADFTNQKLWYVRDTMYILAANLDWKSSPAPGSRESPTIPEPEPTSGGNPQILGQLALEITLHTSVAKSLRGGLPLWPSPNEHYFSEAAFATRSFVVTLEKGNFLPDDWVGREGQFRQRWGLRLRFDKSPYPPREGLRTPVEVPVSEICFDGMVNFVARLLPDSETRGRAMNDGSDGAGLGGKCVVC